MAAVGEVMLRWGFLETVMLEKLSECKVELQSMAPPIQRWRKAAISGSDLFKAWSHEIEHAALTRNLLAHGLNGAHSQPNPEVTCRHADGHTKTLTYTQLLDAAQEIDLLRLRLRRETADTLRIHSTGS